MRANFGAVLIGLVVSVALYLSGNHSSFTPAAPPISVTEAALLLVVLGILWMLIARIVGSESRTVSVWLFLGSTLVLLLSFNMDWPVPYRLFLLTAIMVGLALIHSSRIWVAMIVVSATVFVPWMVSGGYESFYASLPPTYIPVLGTLASASFIPLLLYVQRIRARPRMHIGPWVHFVAIGGVLILVAVVSYSSGVSVARETIRIGTLQMATDRSTAIGRVADSIENEIDESSVQAGGLNITDSISELAAGGGFKVFLFGPTGPEGEDPVFVLGALPSAGIVWPDEYYADGYRSEREALNDYLVNGVGIEDPIWHTWGGPPVSKLIGDDDLSVVLVSTHPFWWGQAETGLFARRALDAFYVWIYLALLFPLSLSLFVQAKREDALTKAGEEQERARVRQDVHDRATNRLTALAVDSETIAASGAGAEEFNQGLSGVLRNVVDELALISGPKRQGEVGSLVDTVSLLSAERAGELSLPLVSQIDEALSGVVLTRDETLALEAILGEAIANVRRHSGASGVSVSLNSIGENMIELVIADDGAGFEVPSDLGSLVDDRRLGLAGMERRMKGMGGTAEIISSPGKGCRVVARWTNE